MSDKEEDPNSKRRRSEQSSDSSPENPKKVQKMSEKAIADVMEAIQKLSTKMDNRFDGVDASIKEVKEKLDKLKTEVVEIQLKVDKQDQVINQLQQDSLASSFNVYGLPNANDRKKSPLPILQKLLKKIDVTVTNDDFKALFCVPHLSGKGSHIAATCWNERKKSKSCKNLANTVETKKKKFWLKTSLNSLRILQ